ncbi:hypothetical protein AARAC_011213, partial [Aspergillus arachidicola]
SSIPTPAHCTADFCLIPVRSESPFQNPSIDPDNTSGKDQTTIQLTQNPRIRCPDWHLLPLRLRPNRRRPTPNREIRSQVRDAQRRHNPRTDKEQSFEDKVNKVRQLLGKE